MGITVVIMLAGFLGALLGSWAACIGYRMPRGISLWGQSACPYCGHGLSAVDLIPVLGFLIASGRCRYCGVKINPVYLSLEIALAVMSMMLLLLLGPTTQYLMLMILLTGLAVAAVSDLRTMIIPDKIVIVLAFVAAPFFLTGDIKLWYSITGAATGFGAMILPGLVTKQFPGGGDIKLTGVIGLYLGPYGVAFALLISVFTGLLIQKLVVKDKEQFPFAPYLFAGVAGATFLMALPGQIMLLGG